LTGTGRSSGIAVGTAAAAIVLAALPTTALAEDIGDLRDLSIEDLEMVNVSSVSKTDQPLSDAPAAIYVISREDILRSGAATLPEMLRLAPNLQVYQKTPSDWVVTARGLNGNAAAQAYPNKLLVLIDGRPVYTPLFSGVYWDLPDVLPDNIDRIEVISGPGATLWGANAVNGVINVITRRSSETRGLYADVRAGPGRQAIGGRLSGEAAPGLSYEIHGRYLHEQAFENAAGAPAGDGWHHIEGGFRVGWAPSDVDLLTAQGEIIDGLNDRPGTAREDIGGRNLTLRWNRDMGAAGQLQAQVFYDRIQRNSLSVGGGKFQTDTYDAELQHNITAGAHTLVWGVGARLVDYRIHGTGTFFFDPPHRNLFIADAFVQGSVALTDNVTLIAGIKAEHLPYAGISLAPELRLSWKPASEVLQWASADRAMRSPTPFDKEVHELHPPLITLNGNPQFRTEKLTSFELGTRLQPARSFSMSLTGFYHRYEDLRSIELGQGPFALNLMWGNNIKGDLYGIEAWADWQVTPWWTLSGGATVLQRDLRFAPGASGLLGLGQAGNDPPYTAKLRSSINPMPDVSFDIDARAVGPLHLSDVPAYLELDGRVAWQVTPAIAVSLSGTSLLHDRHQEYPAADYVPRRIMGGLELRY
jgi:iron complex outermembrane receptor protein